MRVSRDLTVGGFISWGFGGHRHGHQVRPGGNSGFNCCLAGTARFIDHDGAEHRLSPGMSAFHPSGGLHRIIASPDYQECHLICSQAAMQHFIGLGLVNAERVLCHHAGNGALEDAWHIFKAACERSRHDAEPLMTFIQGLQLAQDYAIVTPDLTEQLCAALRKDPEIRLDLKQLAADYKISYATMHRRVKAATGMAPKLYRLQQRLLRADELLQKHAVQDVASMLGYLTASDFCRQYKAHRGISPRQFVLSKGN